MPYNDINQMSPTDKKIDKLEDLKEQLENSNKDKKEDLEKTMPLSKVA